MGLRSASSIKLLRRGGSSGASVVVETMTAPAVRETRSINLLDIISSDIERFGVKPSVMKSDMPMTSMRSALDPEMESALLQVDNPRYIEELRRSFERFLKNNQSLVTTNALGEDDINLLSGEKLPGSDRYRWDVRLRVKNGFHRVTVSRPSTQGSGGGTLFAEFRLDDPNWRGGATQARFYDAYGKAILESAMATLFLKGMGKVKL
jgi:hypothetical protein